MASRFCVYTVLVGGYETLQEQGAAATSAVDFICFTDRPDLVPAASSWQARQISWRVPNDAARSSRWPKLLAHEVLPDYDCSLYIDNTVDLIWDPLAIRAALLPPDAGLALMSHSFRASVLDEFQVVIATRRDAQWVCEEQLAAYSAVDPGALAARPLWGGFLLREHHRADVIAAMELWWEQVLRYSRRDQLSLPFALRAADLTPVVHHIDNHRSDFHSWPRPAARDNAVSTAPLEPDATIRELRTSTADLTRALAAASKARESLQERLAASRSELSGVKRDLAAAETILDRMRRSNSWRLTAPLRRLSALRR